MDSGADRRRASTKATGDGGEQGEQHGQRQRHRVDAGQPLPAERQLLVVAVDVLHPFGVERQVARHRLGELQDARLHAQARGNHRHQHAQHQILAAGAFDLAVAAPGARLAQRVRRRRRRQEDGQVAGRRGQQLPRHGEQRDVLHADLLAQAGRARRGAAVRADRSAPARWCAPFSERSSNSESSALRPRLRPDSSAPFPRARRTSFRLLLVTNCTETA